MRRNLMQHQVWWDRCLPREILSLDAISQCVAGVINNSLLDRRKWLAHAKLGFECSKGAFSDA